MNKEEVLAMIGDEIESAYKEHGGFNSPHEGWAVIREEKEEFIETIGEMVDSLDEKLEKLWEAVKLNKKKHPEQRDKFLSEGLQLAAMVVRFVMDFC